MSETQPCPFCGSSNLVKSLRIADARWSVSCGDCGASGPRCAGPGKIFLNDGLDPGVEEVAVWNRRVAPEAGEAEPDATRLDALTDTLARCASGAMLAHGAASALKVPSEFDERVREKMAEFDAALAEIRAIYRRRVQPEGEQ